MLDPSEFQFGPLLIGPNRTRFRLWAPAADRVFVTVGNREHELSAGNGGWHEAEVECAAGTRYRFRIGDTLVPDPASRMQEKDVHDPSVVTDSTEYRWRCSGWKGRPWQEAVLYELHPGLLGGFVGIEKHLERLADLGVTAIELMPIADFPSRRNWGYDGVLPFAPDRAYGTPDQLKALIDAAHERELMVLLDVVYNHFGPDGNYLSLYAPQFFDETKRTPWGAAINFGQPEVRRFFTENAIYWLKEFRFDGLRFDAVHAICDKAFLPELAREIRAAVRDRQVHLVLENDDNDAGLLRDGYDAQWDDDLHHVIHVLLTHETRGYYEDYARDAAANLSRGLSEGFIYQGDPSPFRGGTLRGSCAKGLSPTAFVSFLQNHDQVGNRAFGERLTSLTDPMKLEAAIALQLLAPQIPLIFMGEESGAREPFLYFTDYSDPKLAAAVREGRREEFAKFPEFADDAKGARIPDPNALTTFEMSRPDFADNARSDLYRHLLRIRRERVVPFLKGAVSEKAQAIAPSAVTATWRLSGGKRLILACNLGDEPVPAKLPTGKPVWGDPAQEAIPPCTTLAWIFGA
ncbi:MAG: malto-oligosyltrehalose trehalohydrolase [Alphaproteobacteria bacterium]|nr:malto-oligosyltrehalose trehalohydrolase [Alphaproteobacteria bacterium]